MFVNYDVHMKSAFVYIHVVHVMCHVGMGIKCCAIVFYHQDEKSFSCGWSWEKILGSLPPNEVPYIRSVPHTDGSDGRNGRVLHRITAPSRIFNLTAIFSDFVEKKCKNGI